MRGTTSATITEITPTTRLRVEYDDNPDSPLTWGDHISEDDWSYRQWAQGEVYGVILERRVSHVSFEITRTETGWTFNDAENPTFTDDWEEVSAIWGCYLTDADEGENITAYTAEIVAASYFELTPEEQDGLNLSPEEIYGTVIATVRPVRPEAHAWLGRAEAAAGYVLDTRPGKKLAHLPIDRYTPALQAHRRRMEMPLDATRAE